MKTKNQSFLYLFFSEIYYKEGLMYRTFKVLNPITLYDNKIYIHKYTVVPKFIYINELLQCSVIDAIQHIALHAEPLQQKKGL